MMYTYTKTEVLNKNKKKSKTKNSKTKKKETVTTTNARQMLRKKTNAILSTSNSNLISSSTNSSLSMITRKTKSAISFAQISKNKSISKLNNSPLRKSSKLLSITKKKSFSKLTTNTGQITHNVSNDVSTPTVKRKSFASLNKSASLIDNELLKFDKDNKNTINNFNIEKEENKNDTKTAEVVEGKSKIRRVGSGRKRKTLSLATSTIPKTKEPGTPSSSNSSSDIILVSTKPNNNISHLLKLQKLNATTSSNAASELSNDNDLELDKNNAINYLNSEILKITNFSKSSPSNTEPSQFGLNPNSLKLFNNTLNPEDDSASNTPKKSSSLFSARATPLFSPSQIGPSKTLESSSPTTNIINPILSGSKKIRKLIDPSLLLDETPSGVGAAKTVSSNSPIVKVPGKRGRKPKQSPPTQPIKLIGLNTNPINENTKNLFGPPPINPPINGGINENNNLLTNLNNQIKTISMSNYQLESSSPKSLSTNSNQPTTIANLISTGASNIVRPSTSGSSNQSTIYNHVSIGSLRPSTPIQSLQLTSSSSSSSSPTYATFTQTKPPMLSLRPTQPSFLQRPTVINNSKPSILVTKRLNVSSPQINLSTSPKSLTTIIRPPTSLVTSAPSTNINLLNSAKTTQNTLWVVNQPSMIKSNSSSNVIVNNTAASVAATVAAQVAKETSQTIISSFLKQQQQQQQQNIPKITTIVNNNTFNANTNNFILNNTNNYTIISSANNSSANSQPNNNNNNNPSNLNLNTSPMKSQIILNKTINLDFNSNKTTESLLKK
jgi:hypothetical protein